MAGVKDPMTRVKTVRCQFDRQNPHKSGEFLLASLTKGHRTEVLTELGTSPDSLTIILHILLSCLLLLLPHQRKLVEEPQELELSDQKGEHAPKFNHKITTKCQEITQVGPPPIDLSNLVVKCHLHTQVSELHTEMKKIHQALQQDPTKCSYHEVTKIALQECQILRPCQERTRHPTARKKSFRTSRNRFRNSTNSN